MELNKIDKKALKVALEKGCTHLGIKNGELEFIPYPKIEHKGFGVYPWNTYTGELEDIVKATLKLKGIKKISIEELLNEN